MQELPGAKLQCFQQRYCFIHGMRKTVAAQRHVWNNFCLVKEIVFLRLKVMTHPLPIAGDKSWCSDQISDGRQ